MLSLWKNIKAIFERRDLIKYFVGSELKLLYKNKLMGFAWAILDPFFVMLVYVVLVSVVFQRGGPQFPILLFSALLSWRWFAFSLNSSVKTYLANASLIQTVKLPLSIFPLNAVAIGGFNYLAGLVVLLPMLVFFEANITLNTLWILPLIILQFVFVLGASMVVSVIGVYFRDLQNILSFVLRIGFYLSPALYNIANVPEKYQNAYLLINPFASLFHNCKKVLVYGEAPDVSILIFFFYALSLFVFGLALVHNHSNKIPKLL